MSKQTKRQENDKQRWQYDVCVCVCGGKEWTRVMIDGQKYFKYKYFVQ